jgi:hypothetical protein
MKRIKTVLSILGLFILTSIFSSCSSEININDYINHNAPLQLTIIKTDNATGLSESKSFEIAVGSDRYKELIEWGNHNIDGWKWTPASYNTDIHVSQGDFKMLHSSESKGVVIGFIDNEGKPEQYSRGIKRGELDFLFK